MFNFITDHYITIIPTISIALAILLFGYVTFEHTPLGKYLFYERISKQFGIGSVQQKRFSSIANAVLHGQKHYTFKTGPLGLL
ncbi:MAG TPA: hypothetical protein VLF93_00695 [Candidatus Saccharimonadales bacterium]|nr:hypothetical protein [Candidatus Saccharimonadales bacterium]